jgi:hypothetical protein
VLGRVPDQHVQDMEHGSLRGPDRGQPALELEAKGPLACPQPDAPALLDRLDHARQVELVPGHPGVPGQGEQLLDSPLEPVQLGQGVGDGLRLVGSGQQPGRLQAQPQSGQGGPQLVGGVGAERPLTGEDLAEACPGRVQRTGHGVELGHP